MRRDASRPRPSFVAWCGQAFRVTSWDTPLWVVPNRRSGRWNVAGQEPTQYCCLDAQAPYAELLRGEDLRTETEARSYRTTLWQLRFDEGAIVDYRSIERAEDAGLPVEALLGDDHERCQAEAAWLRSLGATGVLSPSAALDGSVNLTVFGPRVAVGWEVEPTLSSMVPAQQVASGHAPEGLVGRTRFYGAPHPAIERLRSPLADDDR